MRFAQCTLLYTVHMPSVVWSMQYSEDRPSHRRRHSDTQFFVKRKPGHLRMASEVPHTPPPRTPQDAHSSQCPPRDSSILLRLPLLLPDGRGSLPSVNMLTSREVKKTADSAESVDQTPQFTMGVNLSVLGQVSVTLSPPVTHFITG